MYISLKSALLCGGLYAYEKKGKIRHPRFADA
jgi:hypothetical protein